MKVRIDAFGRCDGSGVGFKVGAAVPARMNSAAVSVLASGSAVAVIVGTSVGSAVSVGSEVAVGVTGMNSFHPIPNAVSSVRPLIRFNSAKSALQDSAIDQSGQPDRKSVV